MTASVRVLAVDDRRENLLALQAILEGLPIEVVPVTSGEEALKRLLVQDYAVILLTPACREWTASRPPSTSSSGSGPGTFPSCSSRQRTTTPIWPSAATRRARWTTSPSPFDPWVLRSKVSVFIDLYLLHTELAERAVDRPRFSGHAM